MRDVPGHICPTCFEQFSSDVGSCPTHKVPLVELSESRRSLVGRTLDGKYEIVELLGTGGMASVYRAVQRPIGRQVAVKVLAPDYVLDKVGVKRFVLEAQAASMLRSRYSATIYDFGLSPDGYVFFSMELATGALLHDAIQREGCLQVERTLHIVMDVCRSLEEAHANHILHRDLKPGNVMLSELDGHEIAKVLDFGTAKIIGPKASARMTDVGMIAGTPEYMSPEQAMGSEAGPSSDLYSLGVMMYEMLTGFPPFSGGNSMKVLLAHLDDPPRPIGVGFPELGVPAEVDAFVLKLLSKDPASRPASAREARIELERLLLAVVGPLSGSALVEHLRSSERASDVGLAAVGVAQGGPGTPHPARRAISRTAGVPHLAGTRPAATVERESAAAWDEDSHSGPTRVDVPAASPTSATALAYYIALSVGVLGVALMAIAWVLER